MKNKTFDVDLPSNGVRKTPCGHPFELTSDLGEITSDKKGCYSCDNERLRAELAEVQELLLALLTIYRAQPDIVGWLGWQEFAALEEWLAGADQKPIGE